MNRLTRAWHAFRGWLASEPPKPRRILARGVPIDLMTRPASRPDGGVPGEVFDPRGIPAPRRARPTLPADWPATIGPKPGRPGNTQGDRS